MSPWRRSLVVASFLLLNSSVVRADSSHAIVLARSNPFSNPVVVPVRAGEWITVEASGTVDNGPCPPPNCHDTGPAGFGRVSWRNFSAPVGSLIGRFAPSGSWFVIGPHLSRTAVPKGTTELWLGIMDDDWSNNGGSFNVTINRASRTVTLVVQRNMSCSDGSTVGTLYIQGETVARTLELPWRNDETDISRIQPGEYLGAIRTDGVKGRWRIELYNVPNHVNVQLHMGKYPSNTKGCILVGTGVTLLIERFPKPGPGGHNRCMLNDPEGALQHIQDVLQRVSENEISSKQLNFTFVVKD